MLSIRPVQSWTAGQQIESEIDGRRISHHQTALLNVLLCSALCFINLLSAILPVFLTSYQCEHALLNTITSGHIEQAGRREISALG